MAQSGYHYSEDHVPIGLSLPLWKMESERTEEWKEIVRLLEESPESLRAVLISEDVQRLGFPESMDSKLFLTEVMKLNKPFGWLLKICLNLAHIISQNLITFLCDIQDSYAPLKMARDIKKSSIHEELGATFEISCEATGVPRPKYKWFHLPDDRPEWIELDVDTGKVLKIENYQLEDTGFYRCHIRHGLPIKSDSRANMGIYTQTVEVRVVPGSVYVTRQPESITNYIGSKVSISCRAKSSHVLAYQWYHNDNRLVGQTKPDLEIKNLYLEHAGRYHCLISNMLREVNTRVSHVKVMVPTLEEIQRENLKFDNEFIMLVQEPKYDEEKRAALGDSVRLTCLAVCKFPLKYEWLKRGITEDLIDGPKGETHCTNVIPVANGEELVDDIVEHEYPISTWTYQCIIECPRTGERRMTVPVRIPMSTYIAPERSLPRFKIALVICQEVYQDEHFHTLNAPKNDGTALIAALKEIDFEVLAFTNVTLEQLRNAIEIFCAFIDEHTYALLYFNGHAIGYGSDMYFAATDTMLNQTTVPLDEQLLWQGWIEERLDQCHPLLGVIIYDSCRDDPPVTILDKIRESQPEPISVQSSFCIGYGTRPKMKSFEYSNIRQGQPAQGLYVKHLLKHLTRNISVGQVFESVSDSFTRDEDHSVARKMTPEFKNSMKQRFFLSVPLRHAVYSRQKQLFFNLTRFETEAFPVTDNFVNEFKYTLGINWNETLDNVKWVTGHSKVYQGIVMVRLGPSPFINEAMLYVDFVWKGDDNFPYRSVKFQVIPFNVSLIVEDKVVLKDEVHHVTATYQSCSKKVTAKFTSKDGPTFETRSDSSLIGVCKIINLQDLQENKVKLRVILHSYELVDPCKGFLMFSLPILNNFPGLKMNNAAHKSSF